MRQVLARHSIEQAHIECVSGTDPVPRVYPWEEVYASPVGGDAVVQVEAPAVLGRLES